MNRLYTRIAARAFLLLVGVVAAFLHIIWLAVGIIALLLVCFDAWEVIAIAFIIDIAWLPTVSPHQWPLFSIGALVFMGIAHRVRALLFLPSR